MSLGLVVKTYDQFRDAGCENCPFFKMEDDHERIVEVTTPNFNGIISVMDPSRSWAARWLRIGKFAPGCYTLAVSEPLPEEMQLICQEEHVQYVLPKRMVTSKFISRRMQDKTKYYSFLFKLSCSIIRSFICIFSLVMGRC